MGILNKTTRQNIMFKTLCVTVAFVNADPKKEGEKKKEEPKDTPASWDCKVIKAALLADDGKLAKNLVTDASEAPKDGKKEVDAVFDECTAGTKEGAAKEAAAKWAASWTKMDTAMKTWCAKHEDGENKGKPKDAKCPAAVEAVLKGYTAAKKVSKKADDKKKTGAAYLVAAATLSVAALF